MYVCVRSAVVTPAGVHVCVCVLCDKYFNVAISAVDVDAGFALIVLRRDAT